MIQSYVYTLSMHCIAAARTLRKWRAVKHLFSTVTISRLSYFSSHSWKCPSLSIRAAVHLFWQHDGFKTCEVMSFAPIVVNRIGGSRHDYRSR